MLETIEAAFQINSEAHTAWEKCDYKEAKLKNEEAKKLLSTFADTIDDRNSTKKIQKVISGIDEEIAQIKKEELKRASLISALRKSHTPEAPPADPDVWLPLPPKPPVAKKSSTPVHRKGEARTPGSSKPPIDKEKKPIKEKQTGETTDDAATKQKDALVEKWTLTGQYDRGLVETVLAMMCEGSPVAWNEILGLEQPKEVFRQTVILPSLLPNYFTGIRRPASSVLLFGPPGTGKTFLAKAVATESNSTFFLVQTADLASKWRGDAEKLVKLLFAIAREYQPATIFFDEIDSIGSRRGNDNEHEASRRLKSQLLMEMDGFSKDEEARILVLGATNFPWLIDEALLRRFEKRLFINLPELEARKGCLQKTFATCPLDENVSFEEVAAELEGYSPADIKIVCRQAALAGVTRLTRGMSLEEVQQLGNQQLHIPVTTEDIREAVSRVKSSVNASSLQQYADWFNKYGSA